MITLSAAAAAVGIEFDDQTPSGIGVADVTHDSRQVQPGWIFCCLPGAVSDGHHHASAAVERGAVALLVERRLDVAVPQLRVPDSRVAMAPLAAAVHGHPSRAMTVVAVTGTNGKTTTVSLMAAIWEAARTPHATIGTLTGARTTPESSDLQRQLAGLRDNGVLAVALEATSIGLVAHRLDALDVDVAVFTNLSRDHLDVHGTMERYFAAKAIAFEAGRSRHAVVNSDDLHGQLLLDAAQIPTVAYSMADAVDLVVGPSWSTWTWRGHQVRLGLGGRFNVANALAAATAAEVLGIAPDVVAAGLSSAGPVAGRFEAIDAGQPFTVVVDYAHTPDGVREVLHAARAAAGPARVLVVFGCGGDRDASKRPAMGEVAGELADVAVVTSDNPRSEDPDAIIAAVVEGFRRDGRAEIVVEADRATAIAEALSRARTGDVVVIAGKGHETTQTVGDVVVPFDDRVVARTALASLGFPGGHR